MCPAWFVCVGWGCSVADRLNASMLIASTIVRGSGKPPAPGAG